MAIAQVALPLAAYSTFDYWVPAGLDVASGAVVRVNLGRRALLGVVVAMSDTTDVARERLQPVVEVVTTLPPLPPDVLALAEFVSRYYQEPIGQVLSQILPPASGKTNAPPAIAWTQCRLTPAGREALPQRLKRSPRARVVFERLAVMASSEGEVASSWTASERQCLRAWIAAGFVSTVGTGRAAPEIAHAMNDEQERAIAALVPALGRFAPFLLQGVTGSGKTEIYLATAAACIAAGGQVLFLVPEINLTPQLETRIAAALPGRRAVILHSRLGAGERRRNWLAACRGDAELVLGTRLAVFVPMPRLALIIVDEEHDPSFKQQDGVRYHGRDVAVWRAHQRGVPIVLGSATPSLESLVQAQRERYGWLKLTRRAVAAARLPQIAFVPNTGPDDSDGLSAPLLQAIDARLERNEQSLVFVNRRGYAPSLLCSACGWQAGCPQCSVRLVVHRDDRRLRCHHCGHAEALVAACPECGNVDLLPLGHGTQRLESALASRFPSSRVVRIDRDSTRRKGAFASVDERVRAGDVDILVGTQMLAKGHDFPRLTLVGVLGADNALYSADFRAAERLSALLFQVAGRAGRAKLAGEVMVQTSFPDHAVYRALAAQDYDALAESLLAERRVAGLPPFGHIALLVAECAHKDDLDAFLAAARAAAEMTARAGRLPVEVYPPVPASPARRAGLERGQVLVQSSDRGTLQRFLPRWREAVAAVPGRRVRWALDVDPSGF